MCFRLAFSLDWSNYLEEGSACCKYVLHLYSQSHVWESVHMDKGDCFQHWIFVAFFLCFFFDRRNQRLTYILKLNCLKVSLLWETSAEDGHRHPWLLHKGVEGITGDNPCVKQGWLLKEMGRLCGWLSTREFGHCLVQPINPSPPCPLIISLSAISPCFLSTSRDGDSPTSLGSLFQWMCHH